MRKFSSRAIVVLVAGLSLAATGCGQVGMLQAKMAFRDANTLYSGQDYRGAAAKYEEAHCAADPNSDRTRTSSSGTATTTCIRPARRGEPANDELLTKAVENYKKSADVGAGPEDQAARARVSRGGVRPRQAERPGAAGAARAGDDQAGSERADQLLRARQDLRGQRRLRGGGADLPEGQGSAAAGADRLHAARRLLQPAGRLRQDDRGARRSAPSASRTTRRPTTSSRPTTGTRSTATSACPTPTRGSTSRRASSPMDKAIEPQGRLLRGDHLQEPAAPAAGERREGSGPAAGAAEGSGPPARPGRRSSARSSRPRAAGE